MGNCVKCNSLAKDFKSEKYTDVTHRVLVNSDRETLAVGHNSSFHRRFTAVKRGKENPERKTSHIDTRRSSIIPK